jgi:hypothetical protein
MFLKSSVIIFVNYMFDVFRFPSVNYDCVLMTLNATLKVTFDDIILDHVDCANTSNITPICEESQFSSPDIYNNTTSFGILYRFIIYDKKNQKTALFHRLYGCGPTILESNSCWSGG